MATVQVFIVRFLDEKEKFFVRGIYRCGENRQYMVCGFAQKDGRGLNSMFDTKLPDFGCQKPSVYVHVPLRFMKTAVAAVAHVLSGHSPDDFSSDLYVESDLGKEIAGVFQKAADEGCLPVEIRPSLEMLNRFMKILAPSGSRRLVCAF